MIDEIVRPNRLIETIRNKKDEIIGYKTYELIHCPHNTSIICIYDSLSLLLPEYRDYVIMPILGARFLFAFQMLLKDHLIALFSLDASYKSFSMTEDDYCFPVYQPPHVIRLVDYLMQVLGVKNTTDALEPHMAMFVEDQISVKGTTGLDRQLSPKEKHYEENILDWHDPYTPHFRAAPKLLFVSDLNFVSINQLGLKLGIKLLDHVLQVAQALLPHLKENHNHYPYELSPSVRVFSDARELFFFGKKKESTNKMILSQLRPQL